MASPSLMTHLFLVTLALIHVGLPMTACMADQHATSEYVKQIELTFYLLQISQGPNNATFARVAGVQGKQWNSSNFGSTFVTDLILLEKPNIYSRRVGRVEGLSVAALREGIYDFQTASFILADYDYSTLQTHGTFRLSGEEPSEIAVTGGTGKFRGAKGFNVLTQLFQTAYYSVSKIDFSFTIPK